MMAVRTIRRGTVRFFGRTFKLALITRDPAPEGVSNPEAYTGDPPYDGRLDGLRGTFYDYDGKAFSDSVFLHSFGNEWPGPNCIDGFFRWQRWDVVPGGEAA